MKPLLKPLILNISLISIFVLQIYFRRTLFYFSFLGAGWDVNLLISGNSRLHGNLNFGLPKQSKANTSWTHDGRQITQSMASFPLLYNNMKFFFLSKNLYQLYFSVSPENIPKKSNGFWVCYLASGLFTRQPTKSLQEFSLSQRNKRSIRAWWSSVSGLTRNFSFFYLRCEFVNMWKMTNNLIFSLLWPSNGSRSCWYYWANIMGNVYRFHFLWYYYRVWNVVSM